MANVQVLAPGQALTRKRRMPNFPVAGTLKPFGLYPIMIHPVLPGETLNHAKTKWRVISKPVVHPLAGAWLESWLVYVKFTDLDRTLGNMFVSDTMATTGYTAASNSERYFTRSGQIDWVRLCVERIAKAFFIHDNESLRTLDGVPQVKLNARSWMSNLLFRPAEVATDVTDPYDTQGSITALQMMQLMTMGELTYEKYLKQYGVQSVVTGIGEPEILRFTRSWTQPTNTVDPSTGIPSSAWIWSDEMEMAKDKRFDEPGFVVMLASVRPKMYAKYQQASIVGNLWGFTDWFPIYNIDDPAASVRKINTDDVVFDALANGAEASKELFYDHLDVLNHGEQFVNTSTHPYALPKATVPNLLAASQPEDLRGEYCTSADIDALFSGSTATDKVLYYEGITSLTITGHAKDLIR